MTAKKSKVTRAPSVKRTRARAATELLAPGLRLFELAERGPSLDDVRAVVEQYARVLRDHGRPLLEGEPGFFGRLRAAAATDGG